MRETKGLKQKAVKGVVWTAAQKYSMTFINFVSDIILARLLTPYDFGCIGMLAIFMILAETFIDSGFGSALIQKKQPTPTDYSTIFYWNLGMSFLLYSVLYFGAPFVAKFYNIPLLCSILRVQGLILFVYAFNVVQHNQLKKSLRFKTLAVVYIIASVISLSVTIVMAYQGFGVWSLVAKNLISAALVSIIFWFFVKWRPKLVFSWQSFRELFGFGFYMFLIRLVNNIGGQIQGLLIGRFYNASTMGFYSKAKHTEGLASKSVSDVMEQVTYPLYAKVQDDKIALQNMVRKLTMTISYITFPLMFVLILLAKPIFVLLYTEKWLESVPYFQILCVAGLFECLQSVNFLSVAAIGKSKISFVWTLVKRVVGIALVVGGLVVGGIKGLLIGMVCSTLCNYVINISMVSRFIGYQWYRQLKDLFPVFFVSIVAMLLSFFSARFLQLNLYPDGIVKLLVFVVLYLGWSFVFKPEAYSFFKSTAMPMLNKILKR